MLKRIISTISLILTLLLFVSCDGATVTEEVFRAALTDAMSNVTMSVTYESEAKEYIRNVRSVDGKIYLKNDNGTWRETTTDADVLKLIAAISKHYDKFSFSDGAYFANDLHLVDEDGNYTDITNVKITFDLSGNAKTISFDELDRQGGWAKISIKLSSQGSTLAPTNLSSGDTSSSGSDDDFLTNEENNSSNSSIENEKKPADEDQNVSDGSDQNSGFGGGGGENLPTDESEVIGFPTDDKGWETSFTLGYSNYSATITQYNGSYENKKYYRVVDGEVYSSYDGESWSGDVIDTLEANLAPFADRFSSYEYDGISYYCQSLGFDEVNIGDSKAEFDGLGRLRRFDFSVFGEECYSVMITFDDFGKTDSPGID